MHFYLLINGFSIESLWLWYTYDYMSVLDQFAVFADTDAIAFVQILFAASRADCLEHKCAETHSQGVTRRPIASVLNEDGRSGQKVHAKRRSGSLRRSGKLEEFLSIEIRINLGGASCSVDHVVDLVDTLLAVFVDAKVVEAANKADEVTSGGVCAASHVEPLNSRTIRPTLRMSRTNPVFLMFASHLLCSALGAHPQALRRFAALATLGGSRCHLFLMPAFAPFFAIFA